MSDFKATMHKILFPLGPQPQPGELTAFPRPTPAAFTGPTSKEREGNEN